MSLNNFKTTLLIELEEKIPKYINYGDPKYEYIYSIVSSSFLSLNTADKKFITNSLMIIFNYIIIHFNFRNKEFLFWEQLISNKNRNIKAFFYCVIPFINENDGNTVKINLKNLVDLFNSDVTNCQYDRCIPIVDNFNGKYYAIKRPCYQEYLENNLALFLQTIQMCSNKLYVNWIDIIPIPVNNYNLTQIYTDTIKKYNEPYNTEIYYYDMVPGLSVNDTYNVIRNYFYDDIKNIRWLIYDILDSGKVITYLEYLKKKIDFNCIHDSIKFNSLTKEQLFLFETQFKKLIESNTTNDSKIIHTLFFFFSKYYSKSFELQEQGKINKSSYTENDDDEEEDMEINDKTINIAKQNFSKLDISYIYDFLLEQFNKFRTTWYYFRTYELKKSLNTTSYNLVNINLTLKNFYNLSKLLSSNIVNGNLSFFPKNFNSLNYKDTDIFLDKLSNIKNNTWFNIKGYVKLIYMRGKNIRYDDEDNKTIDGINNSIYTMVRNNLIDCIFECLIFKGCLSELRPIPNITDEKYSVNFREYQRINVKNTYYTASVKKNFLENSYYYINNQPYSKLKPCKKYETYLDYIFAECSQIWTFMYAMDWVCQLNFFHKYINNSVIYVTGATGRGKSSQIPKLTAYSLIMLDYNNKGKIIATQPRKTPTKAVPQEISMELGLPMYSDDIETNNYFVQFKHSTEKHVDSTNKFIRVVTDGTLVEEIANYPYLTKKELIPETNNFYKYTGINVYDIVMIDESHEHGFNIDMILTFMREALIVNKSLKLIIISATMDDDEKIYRRFYKYVNDNLREPFNELLRLDGLDRINVDRRIDITPPDSSTQFKITLVDSYKNGYNFKNYMNFVFDKTIDVIKNSTSGHILVFVASLKNVELLAKKLNQETANNIYAFEYHSKLNNKERQFIQNINSELGNYQVSKNNSNTLVPKGTYNRAIIIATNIAEASITIRNLKFVVDSGIINTVFYDIKLRKSVPKLEFISKTSAIQRIGRVGRLSDGTVFTLYPKNIIYSNKTAYQITQIDPLPNVFAKLLVKYNDDFQINLEKFVIDNGTIKILYNENTVSDLYDKMTANKYERNAWIGNIPQNNDELMNLVNKYAVSTDELVEINSNALDNYLKKFHNYNYYFFEHRFLGSRSHTGYSSYFLNDLYGIFYLIHPEENSLKRHEYLGFITNLNENMEFHPKYKIFIESHEKIGKILENTNKKINENILNKYMESEDVLPSRYYKTIKLIFLEFINNIISKSINNSADTEAAIDNNYINWIMNTPVYGNSIFNKNVLGIIAIILTTNNLSNIFVDPVLFYNKCIKKYKLGDLQSLYALWLLINEKLSTEFTINFQSYADNMYKDPLKRQEIEKNMNQSEVAYLEHKEYYFNKNIEYSVPEITTKLNFLEKVLNVKKEFLEQIIKNYARLIFNIEKEIYMHNYSVKNRLLTEIKNMDLIIDPSTVTKKYVLNNETSEWLEIYTNFLESFSSNLAIMDVNGICYDYSNNVELDMPEYTTETRKMKYYIYSFLQENSMQIVNGITHNLLSKIKKTELVI